MHAAHARACTRAQVAHRQQNIDAVEPSRDNVQSPPLIILRNINLLPPAGVTLGRPTAPRNAGAQQLQSGTVWPRSLCGLGCTNAPNAKDTGCARAAISAKLRCPTYPPIACTRPRRAADCLLTHSRPEPPPSAKRLRLLSTHCAALPGAAWPPVHVRGAS